jgi:hypothetical protein
MRRMRALLAENPDMTNYALAKALKIDPKTAGKYRVAAG